MRVISGSRKGQVIQAVPGKSTRPTTDKVKEALFNLIGQPFFEGGYGLDLYAGTGSLGIEALSRGFEHMIFVDQHPLAIRIIKQNIKKLHFEKQSEIYKNDAHRALKALKNRSIQFNMIFLDPPYARGKIVDQLTFIDEAQMLFPQGIVIVEASKESVFPERVGAMHLLKHQIYGETTLTIYIRQED